MISKKENQKSMYFLPLGGVEEIGMNLNLYGAEGKWLMVDCGVSFNDQFGYDIVMPGTSFIEKDKQNLEALLLTHAHEDHIGAVPYLWQRFKCPVYATPFTAFLLKQKLREAGLLSQVTVHELKVGEAYTIGPFNIELVNLTHSIPEPNAVLIKAGNVQVFHTGDWKIDPNPLVGDKIDEKRLAAIGQSGIDAMVCDSTNVFQQSHAGSEKDVYKSFEEVFEKYKDERIVVTCFASNVARLHTVASHAKIHGRKVYAVGKSIFRMEEAARRTGYLADVPAFLTAEDVQNVPESQVVILCTGSQGEHRAALKRMVDETHPTTAVKAKDIVVFSSRVIPGNEKRISALKNAIISKGCRLVSHHDYDIHVSGHPSRPELEQMYEWIKPRIAIPVHGELQHLVAHARLAKACGVKDAVIPENGSLIKISSKDVSYEESVECEKQILDGKKIIPWSHPAIKERIKLSHQGIVSATVLLEDSSFTDLDLKTVGLALTKEDSKVLRQKLQKSLKDVQNQAALHVKVAETVARKVVKTFFEESYGKRPNILITVMTS